MAQVARRILETSPIAEVAQHFIRISSEVRATQALFLPGTHLDAAEAAENLAVGIGILLSCDRSRLFTSFPSLYGDFGMASGAEAVLRTEARTIRALYTNAGGDHVCDPDSEVTAAQHVYSSVSQPSAVAAAQEDWSIFE